MRKAMPSEDSSPRAPTVLGTPSPKRIGLSNTHVRNSASGTTTSGRSRAQSAMAG
jgi:hypothetical protein